MDIISNGGFVGRVKETLVELVLRNLADKRNKESKSVKARGSKRAPRATPRHKSSIATITPNIILNSLRENSDDAETQGNDTLEQAAEEPENEKGNAAHGGYGTIKPYAGMSPYVKYADYGKIWGHLGAFRTNAYVSAEKTQIQIAMDNGESSREMVSYETMNKAERHFKYFVMGDLVGEVGLVPPVGIGIDSKEWEKYRLMTFMSIYRPLLKLMRSVA